MNYSSSLLTEHMLDCRGRGMSWDETWVAAGRLLGFNHPVFVRIYELNSGKEVSRGKFLLKDLAGVLEDELGIAGDWIHYFGGCWIRLNFTNDTDAMLAKLRFEGAVEDIPK